MNANHNHLIGWWYCHTNEIRCSNVSFYFPKMRRIKVFFYRTSFLSFYNFKTKKHSYDQNHVRGWYVTQMSERKKKNGFVGLYDWLLPIKGCFPLFLDSIIKFARCSGYHLRLVEESSLNFSFINFETDNLWGEGSSFAAKKLVALVS